MRYLVTFTGRRSEIIKAHDDEEAIQRWVGHADYQTTANIYFKAQDEFLKSNAKKLNDYQTAYWRDVTEDDI